MKEARAEGLKVIEEDQRSIGLMVDRHHFAYNHTLRGHQRFSPVYIVQECGYGKSSSMWKKMKTLI